MIIFRLVREGFLFAVNSIVVNKLRTFLSLFGITIGIFAIISVFTVLDWMENSVRDNISTFEDDVIYVEKFPWSFDPDIEWWNILKWPRASTDDFQAILKQSTKASSACFKIVQSKQIKYNKNLASNVRIWATTHDFINLRSFEIEKGRYFSPNESLSGKNVAIIGSEIAKRLFEKTDPVGKQIKIGGIKTNIIGVFVKEGQGVINESTDEITLVPLNFAKTFVNMNNNYLETTLLIKAKEGATIQELSDETIQILRSSRRLGPGDESTFSINKSSMLSQGFDSVFAGINIGGWIIGGFSILVGGFGIANIMFVSVKERTNIIGIQKALGAKRSFILWQFLYESVILSILGGLFGLLFIFIGSEIINYIYELNIALTASNVILGLSISGIIGVVAGYAPAYSAAKMNPVDAIGYSF